MALYQQGNHKAFEQLYHRHKGGLYRYFLRQTPQQSQAEELFQDVWKKVVMGADNYQPSAKFTTWLYTLARNTLIDQVRHLNVVEQVIDSQVQADEASVIPLNNSSQKHLEDHLGAQAIKHCLTKLPNVQLESFMLREEGGFSVAEVAHITQAGLEATKSRLRYAYKSLRECVTLVINGATP